ncbi:MAG TPA: DUF1573 domain-containing protein [Chitinophagaceae bacterium]|jgi:hypothetical protein|nr:MAG: hypothetical protein BWZ05_01480 [Bacteroidetes bacterium ADurb.BinA245]HMW66083.1 DUF1573 domain-containing protein [Chitinophagaceae bacterium]HNA96443.1 DUF1573 domain-containing protein [Chitinophagaceae bacterium]HND94851.1 DUF1573 domain-containing protein [Chitinophagaceae bacterium]HNF47295.1 DUF1573 domain-containing protein [Chitinophagaceae bacterium]
MIKTSLLSLFFFVAVAAQAQHEDHNHKPTQSNVITEEILKFNESVHDFGQIPQGKPVYFNFEIVNTGKTPLKLDNVQASCGCTTPEWTKDPIAPGASSTIRVGYNAAAINFFEKYITVTYNTNQTKQLTIKGTVWKAPDGSAPANASIDLLKKQTF